MKKLSELMREGAQLHPQTCGGTFATYDDETGEITATCAFGAVLMAIDPTLDLQRCSIPNMESLIEQHTGVHTGHLRIDGQQLYYRIIRRNDGGESREKIAAWLENIGL